MRNARVLRKHGTDTGPKNPDAALMIAERLSEGVLCQLGARSTDGSRWTI
jgi:hypothetical protein